MAICKYVQTHHFCVKIYILKKALQYQVHSGRELTQSSGHKRETYKTFNLIIPIFYN